MKISIEQVKEFVEAIKDIENWKGEAYQHGDDVHQALVRMKVLLEVVTHGKFVEVCPHCGNEQEVDHSIQDCPECGKVLVGCAICANCAEYGDRGCGNCPDGTDYNFDFDVETVLS